MQITFDTAALTDEDRALLLAVLSVDSAASGDKPESRKVADKILDEQKPKKAAPKKVAPKAEEPEEPEEEQDDDEDEDLLGSDGPTLADAVKKATALISGGSSAKVRAALKKVGAPRVSELQEDQVAEFLAALDD